MPTLRNMRADDLSLGLKLCRQAKWNQNEADWQRFFALAPDGCFVAEVDSQPVGTVTAFTFGSVAWIAMVLVDESARGKGVGTALMTHALNYLDKSGVKSIRLDATPMGQPIYEKLGFTADFSLARYTGTLPAAVEIDRASFGPITLDVPRRDELGEIIAVDSAVTKTDRMLLIEQMWKQSPADVRIARIDNRVVGYFMSRPGCNATQLGPAVAIDDDAGALLVLDAVNRFAGRPVFLDVADDNAKMTQLLKLWPLEKQRPFTRMTRGAAVPEDVSKLWLSSGPEKG